MSGSWIIEDNPTNKWYKVTCPNCGENVTSEIPMIGFLPDAVPLWEYCPYCGHYNGEKNEDQINRRTD